MAAKRSTAKKAGSKKKVTKKAPKKKAPQKSARKPAAPAKAAKRTARKKTGAARGAGDQVEQVRRLIDVMVQNGAVEVELEGADHKLRVRLKEDRPAVALPAPAYSAPALPAPVGSAASAEAPAAEAPVGYAGEVFKSPMVGTFYRAPSPDAEPFAKPGDQVSQDSVLCIIEAMKVMNEIKAEMSGEVVEILAENGEPVDYGQPLFVIKV